jgi:DNA-binding MarR family transcriptional regulator
MRVFNKVQRREAGHLHHHGLSIAQFDVLVQLSREEGITQQMLAERLMVTKGNVCGLIDRMSESGLVERRADPDDRRANLLHLTAAGRARAEEIVPDHQEFLTHVMSVLPVEDRRTLARLLAQLDRALDTE